MSFLLVPKSVTLNDLNGVVALFSFISANSGSFPAHCVKVHVRYLIIWWVLVLCYFTLHAKQTRVSSVESDMGCEHDETTLGKRQVRLESILWPNSWMDQDATWYGGRPRPRLHCLRWRPSSPALKGHSSPSLFGPCLLWPNGRPSQQLLSSCYKYQLSLANPRDALHHGKSAANKGGRLVW